MRLSPLKAAARRAGGVGLPALPARLALLLALALTLGALSMSKLHEASSTAAAIEAVALWGADHLAGSQALGARQPITQVWGAPQLLGSRARPSGRAAPPPQPPPPASCLLNRRPPAAARGRCTSPAPRRSSSRASRRGTGERRSWRPSRRAPASSASPGCSPRSTSSTTSVRAPHAAADLTVWLAASALHASASD